MPKITAFNKHRSVDSSDPGFTLPGFKLRWMNGRVSENNPGRPWIVLRKAELPKELVEYLENRNQDVFRNGETIRRGDLVLGLSSEEANATLKKENRLAAREMESRVKASEGRVKVEVNEDENVTQNMVEQFKAARK